MKTFHNKNSTLIFERKRTQDIIMHSRRPSPTSSESKETAIPFAETRNGCYFYQLKEQGCIHSKQMLIIILFRVAEVSNLFFTCTFRGIKCNNFFPRTNLNFYNELNKPKNLKLDILTFKSCIKICNMTKF